MFPSKASREFMKDLKKTVYQAITRRREQNKTPGGGMVVESEMRER